MAQDVKLAHGGDLPTRDELDVKHFTAEMKLLHWVATNLLSSCPSEKGETTFVVLMRHHHPHYAKMLWREDPRECRGRKAERVGIGVGIDVSTRKWRYRLGK